MEKKSFWRRTNRGFVVSMVLLAAVLVYVLVTQLMLVPVKNEVQALAQDLRGVIEEIATCSQDEAEALQDPDVYDQELDRIREKIRPLFTDDGYLDDTMGYMETMLSDQVTRSQQVTVRKQSKQQWRSCTVEEDTASVSLTYLYLVDGWFWDYQTEKPKEESDKTQQLDLSITCKKVDGVWKIYRVNQVMTYSYTTYGGDWQ